MASSWPGALRCAALCALLPATASATPPSARKLTFDFSRSEAPRVVGKDVTFPVTVHALAAVPASSLTVFVGPAPTEGTRVAVPALTAGEARDVAVTLPLHRVGAYRISGVSSGAQLDAFVMVRPDRVAAVSARDYEASKKEAVDAKLNDPRHRAQGGGPLDGIRIRISPEKSRYQHGEAISFHVSIENAGATPRTLVDGDLGFRDMTVYLDGASVNRQGFGKSRPLTDPFPDGVLRLAPGARWEGRATFAEPRDLDEIARWPVSTFTYRFIYQSLAVPFFTASPALEHLWQGGLTAGDDGSTLVVEHDAAPVGAGTAAVAPEHDAGPPPSDAGGAVAPPPPKDTPRCSGAAVGSASVVDPRVVGALLLLVVASSRRRAARARLASSPVA
jgi:hypothetical protein